VGEGMEEGEFSEAREDLAALGECLELGGFPPCSKFDIHHTDVLQRRTTRRSASTRSMPRRRRASTKLRVRD